MSAEARRYADAIHAVMPSETEWKPLNVLLENPGTTSAVLSAKTGWSGEGRWHVKFGQFCRRLEASLGPAPRTTERRDADGRPRSIPGYLQISTW